MRFTKMLCQVGSRHTFFVTLQLVVIETANTENLVVLNPFPICVTQLAERFPHKASAILLETN